MTTLGARVRQIREGRRLSQTEFGQRIGMTRDQVGRLENDKAETIGIPALCGLIEVYSIDPGWLFGDDRPGLVPVVGTANAGPPVVLDAASLAERIEPADALELAYRVCRGPLARRDVRPIYVESRFSVLGSEQEIREAEGESWRERFVAVPLLRDEVAAGLGREVVDHEIDGFCLIYRDWVDRPEHMRCLRVVGDSMQPIVADGSIVGVDLGSTFPEDLHKRMVAARVDGGVTIKWLEVAGDRLILRPQNPQHRHVVLDPADEHPIIGQVVWGCTLFR